MKIGFPKQKLKTSSNHPFSGLKLSPFRPPPKVRDNRPHVSTTSRRSMGFPNRKQTTHESTYHHWAYNSTMIQRCSWGQDMSGKFLCWDYIFFFDPCTLPKMWNWSLFGQKKTNDICWSLSLYVFHATCINTQKNHYHQVSITHTSPQDVLVTQVDVGWNFNSRFHLSNFKMDNTYIHRWWWII